MDAGNEECVEVSDTYLESGGTGRVRNKAQPPFTGQGVFNKAQEAQPNEERERAETTKNRKNRKNRSFFVFLFFILQLKGRNKA